MQQQDAEQASNNMIIGHSSSSDEMNDLGSPGAAVSGQKVINKPSDENQRHSSKVEAIEVRLNSDFYNAENQQQQAQQQQVGGSMNQQNEQQQRDLSPEPVEEQMQEQAPDDPGFQHQYAKHAALVRMGITEEYITDPGEVDDQFQGAYHHAGHHGVFQLQSLSGEHHQGVEDNEGPGGYGGNGQGNGAGSAMFADGVGGQVEYMQEMAGAGVLAAADTGQNDKRFYTLAELAEMEPMFERQFYNDGSGTNQHNAHVLLSPQEYRAKLYWLDPENRWKDIGTGRFRLLLSKDQEEHYIQVVSEDCIEDPIALENDIGIDKVVNSMGVNPADNAQSPQGANGQGQSLLGANTSRQEFLHRCFVFCLQEFSRQGDTIITWQDDYKNEFALSFQDEKGAQNTWWSICFLKGIQINSNIDEPNEDGRSSETNSITGNGVVLPTKENLAELANDLFSPDAYTRRNIAEAVLKQEESISRGKDNGNSSELSERDHSKLQTWKSQYLDKLQKIFNEVEQQFQKATKAHEQNEGDEHDRFIHMQQQVNHLHSLFQIFRNLLNLNQSELLEVLLNENYWMTTFGALEYDPEVFSPLGAKYENQGGGSRSPVGQKPSGSASLVSSPNSNARSYGNYDHFEQANQYSTYLNQEADFREFLSTKVKYKQAVAIEDPQVIYSIHLSYKLQYLKDTAMARFIDENTSHTIMQLVSSLHQIILDYILGDDFERVQSELVSKMHDNSNVQIKENALKFFLEVCALLKSINLTNRQLQTCNQVCLKIMQVLAQTFDIMLPDRSTLMAEVKQDKESLIRIFEARSHKDIDKAATNAVAKTSSIQAAPAGANAPQQAADTKEEVVNQSDSQEHTCEVVPPVAEVGTLSEYEEKMNDDGLANLHNVSESENQDSIINPGRATVEEYLKNPLHSEDPSMTQIDILKSNSIEIFYNLLILLNNVNHSTIREFLCSDHQKKHNYVFLRHLAQHMMYTSQQGIKVSICEFFKDLTSKETSEMQKNFQQIILYQVVSQFVQFLTEDDNLENIEEAERKKQLVAKQGDAAAADTQMKDEELKSQDSRHAIDPKITSAYRKQVDQSRILILQFLNKLIVDNVDSYQLRLFFMNNQVLLKVVDCHRYKSIQTNVEIIKFFKAIIQAKESISIKYMIQKQIFDNILEIFLRNQTKGNLLHSCILNLFEMLTPAEMTNSATGNANAPSILAMGLDNGYGGAPKMEGGYVQPALLNKLYQRLHDKGYVKRVFLNKKYEEGFRKFNRSLRQALDIQISEHDSKIASDRDLSRDSHSQPKIYNQPTRVKPPRDQLFDQPQTHQLGSGGIEDEEYYEDQLDKLIPEENLAGQEVGDHHNMQSHQQQLSGKDIHPIPQYLLRQDSGQMLMQRQKQDDQEKLQQQDADREMTPPDDHYQATAVQQQTASGGKEGQPPSSMLQAAEERKASAGSSAEMSPIARQPDAMATEDPQLAEELQDQDGKKDQLLNVPSTNLIRNASGGPEAISAHSNRAARSTSPFNERHILGGSKPRYGKDQLSSSAPHFSIDFEKNSPITRRRRNSHDEVADMAAIRDVVRQNSNNSNKMLNLSDEANNSNRGGAKSAFSDTFSNPDLDEALFFKHKGTPQVAQIGSTLVPPNPTSTLKLQRQHSPVETFLTKLKVDSKEKFFDMSPGMREQKPSIQVGYTGQLKKPRTHKRERGRRACSEQGPDRKDFGLTQAGTNKDDEQNQAGIADEVDAELHRQLDAKLDSSMPANRPAPETSRRHQFSSLQELRRGESVFLQADPSVPNASFEAGQIITGQKRKRSSDQDQPDDQQDGEEPAATLIKESWVSKRPKLDDNNDKNDIRQEPDGGVDNAAAVEDDQAMKDDENEDQAIKQLLKASMRREPPEEQ